MLKTSFKRAFLTLAIICLISIFISPSAFSLIEKPKREIVKDAYEDIRISAAGKRFSLKVYRDADGNMFFPLNNMTTGQMMKHFHCKVTYLVPMKTVVLGFEGEKDCRIKLDHKEGSFHGKTIKLKTAPFLKDDTVMIPKEAIERAWRVRTGYNPYGKVYYMDPVITAVNVVEIKRKPKLVVKATGPVTFKTSLLRNPLRYVIDIPGAVLDDGLENKDLSNRRVGSIFVSHQSRNPNVVRIIVPLDKGIEVEMVERPEEKNTVQAWLYSPQVVAPVQDLEQERITDFRIKKKIESVAFTVKTTGPVQYEWRRLLPPDNRYFVDIPNTVFTPGKKIEKFNVGYLDQVKIYQHRSMPDPVVRVEFSLHVPSKIRVQPNPKYPQEIQIEVFSETINPRFVQRQGFGVTEFSAKGVVICIDPGHGGGDPGAVNRSYGIQEKKMTLDISMRLAQMLKKAGWRVIMTRTTDRDVSFAGSSDARELGDRVRIANQCRAQVFVSIHIDASYSSGTNGSSTYYYSSRSHALAQHIQNSLVACNGRRNIGVRQRGFFVIRHTRMPAVLVECCFISNPSEAALLTNPKFRQKCAEGIFKGLMSYASNRKMLKPSGNSAAMEYIDKKKKDIEERIEKSESKGSSSYSER